MPTDWTDWITPATVVAAYGLISARIGRVEKRQREHANGAKADLGERMDRMEARIMVAIRDRVRT